MRILPVLVLFGASLAQAARADPVAPPIVVAPPAMPFPGPPQADAGRLVGDHWVDLIIRGDRAIVAEWPGHARFVGSPRIYRVEGLSPVLVLLADRQYEFMWPALTKWAGPDLSRMRERLRQQAAGISAQTMATIPLSPAESASSPRLSDFVRLSSIYLMIGAAPLAEKVMETYVDYAKPRGLNSQETMDWVLAKNRLATVQQVSGKLEQSYRQYEDVRSRVGRSEHSLNAEINQAAVLAEHGQYARSLAMIDAAWTRFQRAGDEQIAGSERQFAWIRACALDGLGRHAEADAAYQVVTRSGEVFDPDFIVESKESIQWRGQWCRRREPLLKAYLINELSSGRPTPAVLALQPGYQPYYEEPALLAKLRADPDVRAAAAKRMRLLPPAMLPALNNYR